MIDVARDPRWGRIAEGPGEDPWLAERFAEAKVCGFQGTDLSAAGNIAATAKHFCAYGAAIAGRDYLADVSDRILHEVYLPPFRAAVEADAADPITIFEGLRAGLPNCEITYASGVGIVDEDTSGIAEALDICRAADVVLLSVGEAANMSGEAASRANPSLPGRQRELAEAVFAIGKPVVILISSGRPLMVTWLVERAHAVVAIWFLGSQAGNAIADVLTGRCNPTGRLPVTWPRDVGQLPIFYAERPSGPPSQLGGSLHQ
jgi:hypothetical protein